MVTCSKNIGLRLFELFKNFSLAFLCSRAKSDETGAKILTFSEAR